MTVQRKAPPLLQIYNLDFKTAEAEPLALLFLIYFKFKLNAG
jgi:hypothetical protein